MVPHSPPQSQRSKGTPARPTGTQSPSSSQGKGHPTPRGLKASTRPVARDEAKGTPRPCSPPSQGAPRTPVHIPWGYEGAAPHPRTGEIPRPVPLEMQKNENNTPARSPSASHPPAIPHRSPRTAPPHGAPHVRGDARPAAPRPRTGLALQLAVVGLLAGREVLLHQEGARHGAAPPPPPAAEPPRRRAR